MAASGEAIVFDQSLNGGTIELSIIGNTHSLLKAEVMGINNTPSGPVSRMDEIKIRSECVLRNIPIVTTESAARATLGAIRAVAGKDWDVKPIQAYHTKIS